MRSVRLGELVDQLGGELVGDRDVIITRLGTLEGADASTLAFLANPKYQSQLQSTRAGCVIVAPAFREAAQHGRSPGGASPSLIVTEQPYLYFARVTQWWARSAAATEPAGIHPSAVVDASARLGAGVRIGPMAVIEAGAVIGEGAIIGAQCYVGAQSSIGAQSRLAPRVSLMTGCHLGQRGIIHSGAVIGADGFGFAPDAGSWVKIEQLGGVRIGDDVEIGANTCIDRGALEDTVIDEGVKLDNLIQIGHNVRVGKHTAMAGCVGVAGSAEIGAYCTIGGAACILGHLTIVDHVHVSVATVVTRSILKPGHYSGVFPFDDNTAWEKNAATLKQLHALRERVRALEKRQS